jgi:hypothetical protein
MASLFDIKYPPDIQYLCRGCRRMEKAVLKTLLPDGTASYETPHGQMVHYEHAMALSRLEAEPEEK